ncbi:helix-turn-helix domain-containing protein [Corallococcus aberystwythensis]|uniref:helix-turn-helix domain-containing protein n=1 Tax=Corallococcus aberystwythensis TaxID=2316722 RepID=UPI001FC960F1|nr:helix-turn-helix transcriptional regulator [Corallococcus aberystwythensis]
MSRWTAATVAGFSSVVSVSRDDEGWRSHPGIDLIQIRKMLARRVGMSRSGFAARFTELVGESPLQYLARWRIARAAELLRDTPEKVETIAGRVGYESVPAFSRAFKRWQGTGPAAFRREPFVRAAHRTQ